MNIIPFSFENRQVRVATDEKGRPLFVAKDLAEGLGYVWNGTAAIKHIPEEWRGVRSVLTPSGEQEMAVLTEQGMYFFLGRSDKPKALPMQKWVAGDVLPSICKTGAYIPDIDSIDHLPPALAKQVGGIIKAVVQKAVNGALAESLPMAVNAYVALRQVSTRRGLTAGQVMSEQGLTKIKNGAQVLSAMLCKRKCEIDGAGRAEMGSSTAKLFDPDKVRAQIKHCFLREQYEASVKERKGQLSLFKVVGKKGD